MIRAARMVYQRLRAILWYSDTDQVEVLIALIYLGWGYTLLITDAWGRPNTPLYVMEQIAPQVAWAMAFGGVGVLKGVGVLGSGERSLRIRITAASAAVLLWALVASCFLVSGALAISFWTYTVFAGMSAIILRKLVRYGV